MTTPLPTLTDTTAWPDDSLDALRVAVAVEQERRATLATAGATVAAITRQYTVAQAAAPGDATPWADVPTTIGPGARVIYEGATYRQIAGTWLPGTATPAAYPLGWAKEGVKATAWKAGTAYKVGDQVTYKGATYQCGQAHAAQVGWEPPNVPALWQAVKP